MSKKFLEVKNVDFNVGGKTKVKMYLFLFKMKEMLFVFRRSGIGKTTILEQLLV